MKNLRLLLLPLLFSHLIHADDNYLASLGVSIKSEILNDKYCQRTKYNKVLCMEYQLEYPTTITSKSTELNQYIKKAVQSYRDNFKIGNAKQFILEGQGEDEFDISGSWDNITTIELFATTSKTFTLRIIDGGYTGGAHPNYTTLFKNYSVTTGKELKDKDLFVPNYKKKLTNITKDYYKKLHQLTPDKSLTTLGWFDNKFVLAETFAITEKGIYFLYNSYEIKPYSDGQTTFMLPYEIFTPLISEKSIISRLFLGY